MTSAIPAELRSERLLLRSWRVSDAEELKRTIDANIDHLRPWVPWATTEPSTPEAIAERVAAYQAAFEAGLEWLFAIFPIDGGPLAGGCGLYPRIGPGGLEIGYWIDRRQTGRGYATESTRMLARTAFVQAGIDRVEIHCDRRNVASAAIPRRLGFRHVETIRGGA